MSSKAEAVIYLANQRGCSEATWFRSYYTFNFGDFARENRTPFGSLVAVNEHTLKEGASLSFTQTESQKVLLIPIAGQLQYRSGNEKGVVDVGQASCIVLPAATPLELLNGYKSSSIHFLQVYVSGDEKVDTASQHIWEFTATDNHVLQLGFAEITDELFFIGKLRGRQDIVYHRKLPGSGIFVYEISGTCEVNGRLLLPGDALTLKNVETMEFEALTHEAIVFGVEVPS